MVSISMSFLVGIKCLVCELVFGIIEEMSSWFISSITGNGDEKVFVLICKGVVCRKGSLLFIILPLDKFEEFSRRGENKLLFDKREWLEKLLAFLELTFWGV